MKIQCTPSWLLLPCLLLTLLACTTPASDDIDPGPAQKGTVSGRATDAAGKPLANATVVINNTQFYNHNILSQTDDNGQYQLALTPGSWYVRGTTKIRFDTKNYVLDLHPDSDAAFAGTEGTLATQASKLRANVQVSLATTVTTENRWRYLRGGWPPN